MDSNKSVARAGLFDRLIDEDRKNEEEVHPKRTLNKKEFIDSVLQDLNNLLNTRSPNSHEQLERGERSVINYGMPEFSVLYSQNSDDQKRLARFLKETIAFYEPRLNNIRVSFVGKKDFGKSAVVRIEADFTAQSIREPVSFSVVLGKENVHVE